MYAGTKSRKSVRVLHALLNETLNVVPVIKRHRAQLLQIQHPWTCCAIAPSSLLVLSDLLPALQRRIQVIPIGTYPPNGSCRSSGRQQIRHHAALRSVRNQVRALPTSPTDVASPLRTAFFRIRSASSTKSPSVRSSPSQPLLDALRGPRQSPERRSIHRPPQRCAPPCPHPPVTTVFPIIPGKCLPPQTSRTSLAKSCVPM